MPSSSSPLLSARRRLAVAGALVVAALAGCTVGEQADSRRAIAPPDPMVEPVTADASAAIPSVGPGVAVAYNIADPSSLTVVVTKLRPLNPASYVPPDLVVLTAVPGGASQQMRGDAADAMTRMYQAASDAGVPFLISTAYRSYEYQGSIRADEARAHGTTGLDHRVARPGHSEHQTGLAADIYDVPANRVRQSFGASGAGVWVRDHAAEFGFIISYPEGSEAITGYIWEPWHVRYVGVGVAQDMREQGVATLQEFFDVEAAPDYA